MNLRLSLLALTCSITLVGSMAIAPCARAQQTVLPLWPHATPEPAQTAAAEVDVTKPTDALISGHRSVRLTNVTSPTLSVYPPRGRNTGASALVFPGGGYVRLAWTGEGLDTCDWLNSLGMTCLLVKYRVPEQGHYPANPADLEDAQQAMRLARAHAAAWHIDPHRIGVAGFSAGGNLAVLLSTHPDDHHVESTPAAPDADKNIDARADFAIVVYPAYLAIPPDMRELDPTYAPNQYTPPTFVIQAEDDRSYGKNSIVYYRALMDAKVPAELHLYATGGHGFGMHPVGKPEENWTQLAAAWLRSINMIPPLPPRVADRGAPDNLSPAPGTAPCQPLTAQTSSPNSPRAANPYDPCFESSPHP